MKMLDLTELLRTQYDEFVNTLWGQSVLIPEFVAILKTKFGHLLAIVEHERLVKSVATVCEKRNTIANKFIITKTNRLKCFTNKKAGIQDEIIHEIMEKQTENTLESIDSEADGTECGQDDRKPDTNCNPNDDCKPLLNYNRDATVENDDFSQVENRCEQDVRKPKTNCKRYDNTLDTDCKQDDNRPVLNCNQDATDDCKPKMDCNQDDNECEQDEGKPDFSCLGFDCVPKELPPYKERKQDDRKSKTKHRSAIDFSDATLTWGPGGLSLKYP